MSGGPEQFVVIVIDDDGEVSAATDPDGRIEKRSVSAVKSSVHGILSTEEELKEARPGVRYAVPVELARSYYGWDI